MAKKKTATEPQFQLIDINLIELLDNNPKKISEMEWIINIEKALKEQHYEPNIAPTSVID